MGRRSKKKRKTTKKNKIKNKFKVEESQKELIIKTRSDWIKKGLINKKGYEKKYNDSIKNNDNFWKKEGKRITWIKPYRKIKDVKYSKTEVKIKWYEDGTLNASSNCIDRHLKNKKDKQQLFGLGIIQKIQKKYLINSYIKKFQKQRMV